MAKFLDENGLGYLVSKLKSQINNTSASSWKYIGEALFDNYQWVIPTLENISDKMIMINLINDKLNLSYGSMILNSSSQYHTLSIYDPANGVFGGMVLKIISSSESVIIEDQQSSIGLDEEWFSRVKIQLYVMDTSNDNSVKSLLVQDY